MGSRGGSAAKPGGNRRVAGRAIAATLIVIAFVLAVVGGSGGAPAVDTMPRIVDANELGELESSLGHSVFWAGERPPARLEVHEEPEGSVYLRYLPPGVEAGTTQGYLTVGTYPVTDAVAALERTAASSSTRVETAPDSAVVLPNPSSEGSVYFAYPDTDIQIEVYDPTPGRALHLIRSGAIGPVG